MTLTQRYALTEKLDRLNRVVTARNSFASAAEANGDADGAAFHQRVAQREFFRMRGIIETLEVIGYRVDFDEDADGKEHSRITVAGREGGNAQEGDYGQEADILCSAIRKLAANEDALNNMGSYLTRHFAAFCAYFASTPENLADEFAEFANLYDED